ncbi:flagellin [Phenylobacterium sp.]|uniref:flagellin n=1 Tax=Phenylobacterium sp. TaxID=1871053 RepID=UPI0026010904|nr:flagellin [Phenylobacterium sp.]MCA3719716.1 flagellin [Phenylobacterium sp.]
MTASINTNVAAMLATQNLSRTQEQLQMSRTAIATGLKVSSAKDNGAIFAIANNERATGSALNAVRESLQRGQSVADVSIAAGETISDLLSQMKEKALAASDAQLSSTSRAAMNADFQSLRNQITNATKNTKFNGASLISASAANVTALADETGSNLITVQAQRLNLSGSNVTVTTSTEVNTVTNAKNALSLVNASIENVSLALAKLGTGSKALNTHLNFVNKLQDAIEAGVGNIVDADLAKESAKLQALQTKEQLGFQALSIANQGPGNLLSLFR